jgi:hypothetical protein
LVQEVGNGSPILELRRRFSTNAAMPSSDRAWQNSAWKVRRSKRMPSASVVSNARLTASFADHQRDQRHAGDRFGAFIASSIRLRGRHHARDQPRKRSASAASIVRPVRFRSIAFALPTARVRRCVPPTSE